MNDISPRSLRLEPFSKFSSTVAPKVRGALPFLKTFGKFLGPVSGAYIGTDRLLRGEPAHKVAMGYGYALPGPLGLAVMAADTADSMGAFSNMSGGNPASNFTGGLPNTSSSTVDAQTSFYDPEFGKDFLGIYTKDTRPVVGGGTVDSRTGGLGKYTNRSIGIPGTQFQVPLGDISPTIDIPRHQVGRARSHGLDNIRTLGELNQLEGSSPFYRKGRGQMAVALRRLELGQQLENEANLEAQMLQEAMSPAEIQARDQWLDATANSPAARSGAFSNDQRWQTHLGDQQWQRDHGRPFTHGEFIPAAAPVVPAAAPVVPVAAPVGGSWNPNFGGFN